MRVTNSMLSSNFLTNMNRNLGNMQTLQNQLSSGKEISRPSDNPYKASRAMQLYTEIDANKQYNENIKDASNWLDTTDTALNQAGNVLARVRELMVRAGDGTYSDDEEKAIKDEMSELTKQLGQILNTNFDGAYIFGGTKSTSKPVTIDVNGDIKYADKDGNPTTDSKVLKQIGSDLKVEISQGVFIDYNVNAKDILEYKKSDGTTGNLMGTLRDVMDNLEPGKDVSKVTGELLGDMDSIITNLLEKRSGVGAMTNRMESAESKNKDENLNMTEILSKTEDIDFTEKMMEYSVMQTVYMASLQTSAKILPSTILDYIR